MEIVKIIEPKYWVLFSTSRLVSTQYPKGAKYWSFDLPEVIFIGVLEFRMDEKERDQYLKNILLIDRDTGKTFYKKLSYIILELPNFVKPDEDIRTDTDRWFWILNNLSKADKIPTFMNKWIFPQIFKIAEVSNLSKEERMAYEASLQDKWIWSSAMSFAEKKAAKEAIAKARANAKQEKYNMQIESARSLKKIGLLSNEQIAESLKLPLKVVEEL